MRVGRGGIVQPMPTRPLFLFRVVLSRWATLIALVLMTAVLPAAEAGAQVHLTDIVGRTVTLAEPADRIVVGSSMNLEALALVHPDPVSLIAGWSGLTTVMDEAQAAALHRLHPEIGAIPVVGRMSLDTMSFETIVALQPDAVLLNLYDISGAADAAATSPMVQRFEAAGIPVVVVDFFVDPLANSTSSLRILGQMLGSEDHVADFLDFYESRMAAIAAGLAGAGAALERPDVFMHAHAAGPDCCYSPGQGVLDGFIRAAGGHNIGADLLTTPTGQLSREYVLSRDPDVYIATGGYARGSESGFTLGRNVEDAAAQAGFSRLLQRPELAALSAVEQGHAHGIWHDFTHSPLHLIAIEVMARWFHPELFPDLNPQATLAEINTRFLAIPLEGTLWIDAAQNVPTSGVQPHAAAQ